MHQDLQIVKVLKKVSHLVTSTPPPPKKKYNGPFPNEKQWIVDLSQLKELI